VRVLGINCFSHDTAACLLEDGRLVALAEEERFNRQRHTKRFPDQTIGFCLGLAGIGIGEVDVVAFAHRPGLDLARGVADALERRAPKWLAVQAFVDGNLLRKEVAFRARWRYRGRIEHVGHHDAHAASAFFPSSQPRACPSRPMRSRPRPGSRRPSLAAGPADRPLAQVR
jgi:carbamoyltransferase